MNDEETNVMIAGAYMYCMLRMVHDRIAFIAKVERLVNIMCEAGH